MASFWSQVFDTPSSNKKSSWTDTALIVFLGLLIAYFVLAVVSNSYSLIFQRSLFS